MLGTQYHDYIDSIDGVLGIPGTSVSQTFAAARHGVDTLRDLLEEHTGTQDALNAAVATGEPEKIRAALDTHTLAELAAKDYDLRNQVERATLATLRVAYRETADANYRAVAKHYDTATKALRESAATVKISARAEDVLSGTAKERTAWELAPVHAQTVARAATVLHQAALLAEVQLHHTTHERHTDQQVALTVDPSTIGIRALWELWDQDGEKHRAGSFGALAEAGVTLRAADIDHVKPQRRPKPYETRYIPNGYGHRPVQLDPEDPASMAQIA